MNTTEINAMIHKELKTSKKMEAIFQLLHLIIKEDLLNTKALFIVNNAQYEN